jgi:hypothetical protein
VRAVVGAGSTYPLLGRLERDGKNGTAGEPLNEDSPVVDTDVDPVTSRFQVGFGLVL